jgi:hypothetical protein
MDEASHTVARVSNPSSITRTLVAIYHFVVSIVVTVILVAFYRTYGLAEDDLIPFKVLLAVAAPFALLYFVAGWGILRQRNWGRILSLVLNWANVLGAVVNFSRFWTNPEAIINGILCCFVLWWLSKPAVKMQFRSATVT